MACLRYDNRQKEYTILMSFTLTTNLAELPFQTQRRLGSCLNADNNWLKVVDVCDGGVFQLSLVEMDRIMSKQRNPGETLLTLLGNRGVTVKTLLLRLHSLGSSLDKAQLILGRKFCAVRWRRPEQIFITCVADGQQLQLECKADGFPTPQYRWLCDERHVEGASCSTIIVTRCRCCLYETYQCHVSNEVEDDPEWTTSYRMPGKQWQSEILSRKVDLSSFDIGMATCDACQRIEYDRIKKEYELVDIRSMELPELAIKSGQLDTRSGEELFAADKVALIISNSNYDHLPNLITPHCDAETLAHALQQLNYKTVTLADINLNEMKTAIKEYRRMLGRGVYAIFYFVGHGFEANGECYLLPTDAPAENHSPTQCLSVDWVLSVMQDYMPALNLILLDICRRYLPCNMDDFTRNIVKVPRARVNRNTVFGYATSGGVGAYEVRGETNGVFMKYLKLHLAKKLPVIHMLNQVLSDIDRDSKVCDLQFPELRTNLSKLCGLTDTLGTCGHTLSYDQHTLHWRLMHELPDPVHVKFTNQRLRATVWFDFCGHFTNKVYVFSSVGDLHETEEDEDKAISEHALSHMAYVRFDPALTTSNERICSDNEEGESVCALLSNLQRAKGEVTCTIELRCKKTGAVIANAKSTLGHVLITRLFST